MNTSEPIESELVKALSKGEIKAFNELFQIYGNRIFRFALGYLKSEPNAEELVQDVFMKIWEKRSNSKKISLLKLISSQLLLILSESTL